MPPRKPTTKKSPRIPKPQESEAGEGSSLAVTRKLEFTSKPIPIIKTITKESFTQPSAFGDTEANIGTKTTFPQWEDIFKEIKHEEFPEYAPHSDPHTRKLDDEVFVNIHKAYLHMVASRNLIFPCIKLLKWLIDHSDAQKCVIDDDNGQIIGVFLPVEFQRYYKLREPDEHLNKDFVLNFYHKHDTNKIMASWWRDDKIFTNRNSSWYLTANLRQPYIYLMALLYQLHGEKDCSRFSKAWIHLDYTVIVSRISLKWGTIISKRLSTCILQAQQPKEGETPSFYMASYLLDVIYA
jgi:hypothetical protein